MEDKSVLDDWREPEPHSVDHYRRALRFLFYNLGILVLIGARIGIWLVQHRGSPQPGWGGGIGVPDLVTIGGAGIWLFSGLGLLAIFRARHERPTDLIFALVIVVHLSTFVLASYALYRLFTTSPFTL